MRPTTKVLITVISGCYLAGLLVPGLEENLYLNRYLVFDLGEYWRLLTVALTHGGLMHLFFNMYALLILGNTLESAIGQRKFLAIFAISQVGASLTSIYFSPINLVSVGASGAIFGLFGAMIIVSKRFGLEVKQIYVIVGINFAIGFIFPGIDWRAHLGGFISGVVAATVLLSPARS
jgi:membrane associated rhomboid family serine protease